MQSLELTDKLYDKLEALFMQAGIKNVTMDDIARKLGISKKTLYIPFINKKDLVKKVIGFSLTQEEKHLTTIRKSVLNAIDELFTINQHTCKHMERINPAALYDLSKYYPESWELFQDYKNNVIYKCIIENIESGVKESLYRDDFDPRIIGRIYLNRVDTMLDPYIFQDIEYDFTTVHTQCLIYHLRGIATPKGIEVLENLIKEKNV